MCSTGTEPRTSQEKVRAYKGAEQSPQPTTPASACPAPASSLLDLFPAAGLQRRCLSSVKERRADPLVVTQPVCVIRRAVRRGMGHPQGAERLHDFSPDIYLAAHYLPHIVKRKGGITHPCVYPFAIGSVHMSLAK